MMRITRRRALQTALLGSAAACSPAPQMTGHVAATAPAGGFFRHGVASGDPDAGSIVIWTRLSDSGAEADAGERMVVWEVAEDPAFATAVCAGETAASASSDWTVKEVVRGLKSGATYYYRFRFGDAASPVGRMKTLPEGALDRARFAVMSCSNYPFGYFNVYDLVARQDDLDAVIHLGDYIYEYGPEGYGGPEGEATGRPHDPPHEILTLADYRRRHAQYKADPCSQAMHAAHPLIAVWDDHETSNNSWKLGSDNHDPQTEGSWEDRRRVALQAYYEWMPVREPEPGRTREAIFRSFSYGDLLTIAAIETRLMARSAPFEYDAVMAALKTPEDVEKFRTETMWDDGRELLGAAQEDYLREALRRSVEAGQPWRVVANQIIMADVTAPDLRPHVTEEDLVELEKQWPPARAFVQASALGLPANFDAWDGYPAARERLYALAKDAGAEGLIVVTGDTHTWWANDLKARDGRRVGVEVGTHSVTSPSPYDKSFLGGKGAEYALLTCQENKSVRYLSGENHGFILLEVRRDGAKARFMAVDTIEKPEYNAFEKAAFDIRRSAGGVKFAGVSGVTLKERVLFG